MSAQGRNLDALETDALGSFSGRVQRSWLEEQKDSIMLNKASYGNSLRARQNKPMTLLVWPERHRARKSERR